MSTATAAPASSDAAAVAPLQSSMQAAAAAEAGTSSAATNLLDRTTCVVMSDGRQAIGVLAGIDSAGNVLLLQALIKKPFTSEVDGADLTMTRATPTFMVPFKHIKGFYQTDKTYAPTS